MSAEHYAEVELYEDGDGAFVRFVCTGTDNNECHQWCAQGCEEQCLGEGIILAGDHPVDLWRSPRAHRWAPHPRAGESICRVMEWLGAVGWQDSGWVDDDKVGEREVTVRDLRDGRHLIETEWTSDDYIWRYPAAAADAGVAA